jgi:hypothetical protein
MVRVPPFLLPRRAVRCSTVWIGKASFATHWRGCRASAKTGFLLLMHGMRAKLAVPTLQATHSGAPEGAGLWVGVARADGREGLWAPFLPPCGTARMRRLPHWPKGCWRCHVRRGVAACMRAPVRGTTGGMSLRRMVFKFVRGGTEDMGATALGFGAKAGWCPILSVACA